MEVLSLCPFRAGALAWQSAKDAWSLTVVVKATFTIVAGAEATLAPVQAPVAALASEVEAAIEDLAPLKPKVDVLVLRGQNEDSATVEVASVAVPGRGPIPLLAPARRLILANGGLDWASLVLRGEAVEAGPVPEGFDFSYFHMAPREQRIDLLRSGVPLVLRDVLPNQPRVETILPQRKPQAFRIHPQTGKASEIILRCDTLCIDAARNLFVLTFRGITDIDASGGNTGTIVVAAHSAGKKIRPDRIERFLRNGEPIEGEANDGRHPLEKRYDSVLAAPKGDTVALPEMDASGATIGFPATTTPTTTTNPNESALLRAGGLPFQTTSSDAPPPAIPPAPLKMPGGGRRLGTLQMSDAQRAPDMPFHNSPPPPVPEAFLPPVPPEGVFPAPPALLPVVVSGPPPLIKPPAMLGTFTPDEKTADLPPGHEQSDSGEGTVEMSPGAAAKMRSEAPPPPPPPVVDVPAKVSPGTSLAGKPPAAPPKVPAPAPKPAPPVPAASLPGAQKSTSTYAAASKTPALPFASKPAAPVAPKPAAPAVSPSAAVPKGPLKVPAPLGPKLKVESPLKSSLPPPVALGKPAPAAPAKPAPVAPEKPAMLSPAKPEPAAPAKPAPVAPEKPAAVAPEKPAMVGPAKPAAPTRPAPMRPAAPTLLFPEIIKPGLQPEAPEAPEVDPSFRPGDVLTLEECAALDAELRHRPAQKKTLLEKNKLSDKQWPLVQKHWADAIAKQTEVGERKLLIAYDSAYVATQEKLGIPVGIDTHAKLQVAAERGTSVTVLGELGLESADQMRIGRVWTQRLADEPARMRELAAAIEKARAN